MNKIVSNILIAASAAGLLLGSASCNDELDQAPIDYPGNGSFWVTETDFTSNIYALSAMFRNNYAANILFWAGELRGGTLTTDLINGSGAVNVEYVDNNYDFAHTQFNNFAGYYGFIAGLNELIYECDRVSEDVVRENVKNGLLGIAYGWRAYSYFQMYRMYGGVPMRLEPQVILGITDPTELSAPRATAQQTLDQIISDINASLSYFDQTTWQLDGNKKAYYWNKACTEMLAGEVYLWSAKVATDDHQLGGDADVAKAKTYFENVVNNYGYAMLDDYFKVWTSPCNKEVIYSVCYSSEDDGVTFSSFQGQMVWSKSAGAGTTSWSKQDAFGLGIRKDGAVSRFGFYTDSPTATPVQYTCWSEFSPSPNRYMYRNGMYFQYNPKDSRRETFMPQWVVKADEDTLNYIADFDETKHTLMGTFALKYRPSLIPTWSTSYIFNNDGTIYRLPLAYMYLAEIANYQGNNADVEKYINLVRKRAFGKEWDESTYGYKAGSFRENENAILREKDKEFLMEGQRWWDIRRLTAVKGGQQTDHFVFQPESCPGFGLDPVAQPWLQDGNGQPIATVTPVLTTAEAHKLLWPIDATLLGSDESIKQNPGYSNGDIEK